MIDLLNDFLHSHADKIGVGVIQVSWYIRCIFIAIIKISGNGI